MVENDVVEWVKPDGSPSSEEMTTIGHLLEDVDNVIAGESPIINSLSIRNPKSFKAGGIHKQKELWQVLSEDYKREMEVNEWISNGVNVDSFLCHFKGSFKGQKYDLKTIHLVGSLQSLFLTH